MSDRIIVLVDMDCFYCQVETRYDPSLKGKPMAVVQYNQWQGGGIIAVNYEARAFGVTRHIRGNEAKKKCPDIKLVHVPSIRGKADLTRYRDAGREVVDVLCRFCDTVQRASVDEAYLDITQAVDMQYKEMKGSHVQPEQLMSTFIVGFSSEDSNDEDERRKGVESWLNKVYQSELLDETAEKLTVAASLVEKMRAAVYESTGFRCSAGIAHNKILAKLACGIHKPQRQTILPQSGVPVLYRTLPLKKIRGLGGKFGDIVTQRLNVTLMSELQQFSEVYLQKAFDEKSGSWLYNIAQGIDEEAVTARLTSKSIGCCKKFPGKMALNSKEMVEHWLSELSEEVSERLEKELLEGNRKATQFVVSYMQTIDGRNVSASRCGPLNSFEPKQIVQDAMELLKRSNTSPGESASWFPPLKFLGLSAGKFVEKDSKNTTIESFFKSAPKKEDSSCLETDQAVQENLLSESSKLPLTPENSCTEESKCDSSLKNSFFLKFFKQEGLIKTPTSIKVEKRSEIQDKRGVEEKKVNNTTPGPTGTSQQATTSEGYVGITNRALRLLQVDESSNDSDNPVEHWVSPGEIFPNLDEVDDDVAALLPSPLQKQLRTRIQKHCEAKKSGRNKGGGKGKIRKSLVYDLPDVSKTKDKLGNSETKTNSSASEPSEGGESCNEKEEEKIGEEFPRNVSPEDIFATDLPEEHKMDSHNYEEVKEISSETSENKMRRLCSTPKSSGEHLNQRISTNFLQMSNISHESETNNELEEATIDVLNKNDQLIEANEILKEICPHCNQLVALQEFPEHLDFHIATDLDREINRAPSVLNPSVSKKPGKSPKKDVLGKRKRGKPGQKPAPPPADKKMKSIKAFFAPVR